MESSGQSVLRVGGVVEEADEVGGGSRSGDVLSETATAPAIDE